MKINSGTFLSYLQLKEESEKLCSLNEEDPKQDNNQKTSNNIDFNTGIYDVYANNNVIFSIAEGNINFTLNQFNNIEIKDESLTGLSENIKTAIGNTQIFDVDKLLKKINSFNGSADKPENISFIPQVKSKNKGEITKYNGKDNPNEIEQLKTFIFDFCKDVKQNKGNGKFIKFSQEVQPIILCNNLKYSINAFFPEILTYKGIIILNTNYALSGFNPKSYVNNKLKIIAIENSSKINTIGLSGISASCEYVSIESCNNITNLASILPNITNKVEQFVLEGNENLKSLLGAPSKCELIKINNNKNITQWDWAPTNVKYAQIRNNGNGNDAYSKFITNLTKNNKNLKDGASLITDTSFFEVSKDKKTCTLNTQLTSADLSNERIFEISKDVASFKYKTEFSKKAKQNLLFGTTIKRNEYTNSENIDGIELGSFINFPSEKIDGTIDVSGNTKISSFEGITPFIGGDLLLSECREITNLEFFPKQIGGNLDLSNCKKLTELGKTFVDRDYAIQVGGILNVTNTPLFDKITELLPSGKKFTDFFNVKGKIVGNDKLGSNNQNTEKIIANSDGTYTCVESVGYEDLIVYVEGYNEKTGTATGNKFKGKFKEAKKDFDISGLPITTFEGCPKKVGGSFNRREGKWLTGEWKHPKASNVSITDNNLKDAPDEVGGSYIVIGCKSIKSLEGAPNKCKNFSANDTSIKNLKGGPADVDGFYYVRDCKDLESLEGLPNKVGDLFSIRGCKKLNGSKKSQNIKLLKAKLTKKDYGRIEWPDAGSLKAGVKSALKGVWDKVKLFSVDDVSDDDKKYDKNSQKKQ